MADTALNMNKIINGKNIAKFILTHTVDTATYFSFGIFKDSYQEFISSCAVTYQHLPLKRQ
jgi:hypothetical protein